MSVDRVITLCIRSGLVGTRDAGVDWIGAANHHSSLHRHRETWPSAPLRRQGDIETLWPTHAASPTLSAAMSQRRVPTPPVARAGGGGGGAGGAPRVVIVHVCFGLGAPEGDVCGNTLFEHMNGRWYCMRCGRRHRGSWDMVAHFLDRVVVVDAVASEHLQSIDDLQVFLRVAIALRRNVFTGQTVSDDGRITDAVRMVVFGEWV